MKKVFFLLYSMNVGGVEKAFLGLLSAMPLNEYEVHIGLLQKEGGFMKYLPTNVIIHEIPQYYRYKKIINNSPLQTIRDLVHNREYISAIIHIFLYFHYKITSNRYLFYKYLLRKEPVLQGDFDLAIAYAGPSQMIDYYICKKVNAKVKCGWIHFDISQFGIDKGMTSQLYKSYRKIYIVSETAKKIFDNTFPKFRNKTDVFYNIVSSDRIKRMANSGETFTDKYEGKRILTVGRLSKEKGQREAIRALGPLIENGYNIRWYFVGNGNDKSYCEKLAKDMGLINNVVFLGTKTNPYGYMRDCDIYVQPSRHEGFCITLAEALCFSNPIVATNFTGATEQLKDRDNAIVTGMDPKDISDGIIRALGFSKTLPAVNKTSDIIKLLSLIY